MVHHLITELVEQFFRNISNKIETKEKKGLMAVANDYRAQAITQNCLKVLDLKVNYCGV